YACNLPSFPTRRSSDLEASGRGDRVSFSLRRAGDALHERLGLAVGGAQGLGAAAGPERRLVDDDRIDADSLLPKLLRLGERASRSEEHTSELQSRENLV